MTLEQIRFAREAVPFIPFTVFLADGRFHRIPHRDFLSFSPSGRMVLVYHPEDAWSVLDTLLVTELRFDPRPVATSDAAR